MDIKRFNKIETELNLIGCDWDDEKTYFCKPTEYLQKVLSIVHGTHYNDNLFFDLTDVIISFDKEFNITISTWQGDDEINDAIRVVGASDDYIELLLSAITEIRRIFINEYR